MANSFQPATMTLSTPLARSEKAPVSGFRATHANPCESYERRNYAQTSSAPLSPSTIGTGTIRARRPAHSYDLRIGVAM